VEKALSARGFSAGVGDVDGINALFARGESTERPRFCAGVGAYEYTKRAPARITRAGVDARQCTNDLGLIHLADCRWWASTADHAGEHHDSDDIRQHLDELRR